jgi:hypothetical protein
MLLKEAITYWVTESGYRQVQSYLSRQAHAGITKYALANAINTTETNDSYLADVVETLRSAMEPSDKEKIYYRGDPSEIKTTYIREGFFAVSLTPDKAESYGKVYKVYVDADVPRLQFEAEGGEVLLANGMVYEYPGPYIIHVRTPKTAADSALPFLGNLYATRKAKANAKLSSDTLYVMSRLYCISLITPDNVLGYGNIPACDDALLAEFSARPVEDQISILKKNLIALKVTGHLDLLKSDIVFLFPEKYQAIALKTIDDILTFNIGGYRKKRKTRRRGQKKSRIISRNSRRRF